MIAHDSEAEQPTLDVILARFAAEYAEHGADPKCRLTFTMSNRKDLSGYVGTIKGNQALINRDGASQGYVINAYFREHITRIDYSNARYRGDRPLWDREG